MFSRKELIELLDAVGFTYELDQENPGIITMDGSHYSYDDIPLPSEYLKTCTVTI